MKTKHRAPFLALLLSLSALSAAGETMEIRSAADWHSFAGRVNSGETELCATMTADVTLPSDARRVGSGTQYFKGTFDGAGHTLTVNWTLGSDPYAAPFCQVKGCTIRDLHVAGSISSGGQCAAGLVGYAGSGNTLIERCRCSVAITSTRSGEAACGGFVGSTDNLTTCKVTIQNCVFDGSLLGSSATTCGGFVGSKYDSSYLYLYNNLFDPADVTMSSTGSATFSRGVSSSYIYDKMSDCYYARAFGTEQGTDASSMSAEDLAAALGANWQVVSEGGVDRAVPKSVPDPDPIGCESPCARAHA